ncbi:MAG: GAF domain-containing protein [Anaerolineales bacterium]|nr:GAF domain-containing protein [Anaerolineales bacterium]
MNNIPPTAATEQPTQARSALQFIVAFVIVGLASFGATLYLGISANDQKIVGISAFILVSTIITLLAAPLTRRGKHIQAMLIVGGNIAVSMIVVTLLIQGVGVVAALITLVAFVAIANLGMSSQYAIPGILSGIFLGLVIFLLDSYLQTNRIVPSPQIQALSTYVAAGLILFFIIALLRQFNRYSLQAKITIGILATGLIIIVAQTALGAGQVGQMVGILTQRYEEEGRARVNDNLKATIQSEAETANSFFAEIQSELGVLAQFRANLENNKAQLSSGTYWDAATKVFQLSGGQYGNSPADPSSVFVPSIVSYNEAMIADLNTSAYLDFSAQAFLSTHAEVVALYYISDAGASTYYPNINLAQNGPGPLFDPRGEAFYTIANPQNDPERELRWTDVYVDPANQGLIVTISAPVYQGEKFLGVISADIKLDQISNQVAGIHPGKTGFAFLVDAGGRILFMPPQGYELYDLQPEVLKENETPHQSILSKGDSTLQETAVKITNGETGLTVIQKNKIPLYIGFAPLSTPNYRLVIVAPESEFIGEITAANQETQSAMEGINRNGGLILVALFIVSILISIWIGQLITRPLVRLTRTVDKISTGDLSARAMVASEDETGRLALAFNDMAERLSSTLSGLEKRISERTNELEVANQNNEKRALQFESVARIAQIIGATEAGEDLLAKVAEVISQQFNFYHVAIYLLDLRKEYVILTAANSEGGKRLLRRNHRVLANETSMVGYAAKSGKARIALNTEVDSMYSTNPELSLTRSEIALPLMAGSEIIGVLDVQSQIKNAFSEEDVNIMTTLARQVSIAIQNSRARQETIEALRRAESASMELSRQSWRQFTGQKQLDAIVFNGVDAKTAPHNGKSANARDLTIPLTVRGNKIGSIKLSSIDPTRAWNEDELALLQAAADRTSLALENARLLQEAQRRASKEKTIGEITSKISGLVNIENILETAIKELGASLSSADVSIQFAQEDPEQGG